MKNNRLERVNAEIQRELAQIINNDLRDPQITSMIGISSVDVAPDLANARVYLSVYGGDAQDTLNRIKGAGSFIRGRLSQKIRLRITPRLDFYLDNSFNIAFHCKRVFSGENLCTATLPFSAILSRNSLSLINFDNALA